MAGLSAGGGGGFDYIQAATPADPEMGDLWYDTDGGADGNGEAKVWDGDEWDPTGYISHDQLQNVAPADHHDPVTVGAPITRNAQALALAYTDPFTVDGNDDLALALGNALAVDAGRLAVQDGQIDHDQTTGGTDPNAHHTKTTSGEIDHDQTTGGTDPNAHHSKTTSDEIDHDSTQGGTRSDAHHTRPQSTDPAPTRIVTVTQEKLYKNTISDDAESALPVFITEVRHEGGGATTNEFETLTGGSYSLASGESVSFDPPEMMVWCEGVSDSKVDVIYPTVGHTHNI